MQVPSGKMVFLATFGKRDFLLSGKFEFQDDKDCAQTSVFVLDKFRHNCRETFEIAIFEKRLKHILGTLASLTWDSRTPCSTFWGQPLFTCEADTEAQIGDTFATLDSPNPWE